MEYMDQSDDRLKPEGELPAAHSPIPSSLRAVGCWEKADLGDKEASSAGPSLHQLHEDCRAGEEQPGRNPGMADPSVEAVAGPGCPLGSKEYRCQLVERVLDLRQLPPSALCSEHPPTKWGTGTEEPVALYVLKDKVNSSGLSAPRTHQSLPCSGATVALLCWHPF